MSEKIKKKALEKDPEINRPELLDMIDSIKKQIHENIGNVNIYLEIQKIIHSENAEFMYLTANEIQAFYPVNNLVRSIAKTGDSEWCYMTARYIKTNVTEQDKQMLGETVIRRKEPYWNYVFARNIDGANRQAHLQVVLDSGNPRWNLEAAQYVQGADRTAHGRVISEGKDLYYKQEFQKLSKPEKPQSL